MSKDCPILLITGASGFLGSEIVRQAVAAGLEVRATSRKDTRRTPEVEYIRADILTPDSLRAAMGGVEIVIHAAGLAHVFNEPPGILATFRAVNEIGTANVVRTAAAAGVRHCVLVSSVSVYGHDSKSCDETAVCRPWGAYAESKLQAERRAAEIARLAGMRLTILRMATIYGEWDPGNVARLIAAIDRGRFIWVGSGANRKSLIYREDAARACIAALHRQAKAFQVFNVSAAPYSMREIVDGIFCALDRRPPAWHLPARPVLLAAGALSAVAGGRGSLGPAYAKIRKWLEDDVYDAGKFRREFAFKVQVDLAEGLRREVSWYLRQTYGTTGT